MQITCNENQRADQQISNSVALIVTGQVTVTSAVSTVTLVKLFTGVLLMKMDNRHVTGTSAGLNRLP